jgi:hypothetical protein
MFFALSPVIETLVIGCLSGLVGLACMSGVLGLLSSAEALTVGPVRAIGTLFHPRRISAQSVGWMVHTLAAMAFGVLYTSFLKSITPPAEILYLLIAGSVGFAHGFIVFFMLIPLLAEHHPAQVVRDEGSTIGLLYIVAHIAFGLAVGSMFLLLN